MGRKSQSIGSAFENIFERLCKPKVALTRVPDSCRVIAGGKIIRVKSPFDWILSYENKTALIDTKTVDSDTFACSMINATQVTHLFNHEKRGTIAGYVIWLRVTDRVFFIPARALKNALGVPGSFSDTHPQAIYLGPIQFEIRLLFQEALKS